MWTGSDYPIEVIFPEAARRLVDKRRLAYNLVLGALLFVTLLHTVLAVFIFETELEEVSALAAGLLLVWLTFVNL